MKGLIIFTIGLSIGFIAACFTMEEEPSYVFEKMVNG